MNWSLQLTRIRTGRFMSIPNSYVLMLYLGSAISLTFLPLASQSRADARFTPLELVGTNRSRAYDVSDNGSVVVGFADSNLFRWTESVTMSHSAVEQDQSAVSGDGAVVVGSYNAPVAGFEAFRWMADGTFEGLGDLPGGSFDSAAYDVSADGSIIIGAGTSALGEEAFRWTQATGMVGLGDLPGGTNESVALGVSSIGDVVVGYSVDAPTRRQAFRWTAVTGMVGLGRMPGAEWSVARSVSADGSVVAGFNSFPSSGIGSPRARAFRWTASEGMVSLSSLPDQINQSEANDVSADGSVIVGNGTTLSPSGELQGGAFYWTAATGMVNLQELLVSAGVTNLDGWSISDATAVSADGLTVVGSASDPTGRTQAYVATIPEPSTLAFAASGAAAFGGFYVRAKRRRVTHPQFAQIS